MHKIAALSFIACVAFTAGCGGAETQNSAVKANVNKPAVTAANDKKPDAPVSTTSAAASSPSAVVKEIYDNAIKRNCGAITAHLTEKFKKEVGTDKDSLDALCDTFTDSGKVTAVEVKSEAISGDTAKVKVSLTKKDGKSEEKEENMERAGDKWVMGS